MFPVILLVKWPCLQIVLDLQLQNQLVKQHFKWLVANLLKNILKTKIL